jgi:hypothetical protein
VIAQTGNVGLARATRSASRLHARRHDPKLVNAKEAALLVAIQARNPMLMEFCGVMAPLLPSGTKEIIVQKTRLYVKRHPALLS